MTWWQAIILGLVEGITEYLPVSSTGHLIIAADLIGLRGQGADDAIDTFNIVIQGGAILAVVGLYRARFVQMLRGLFGLDAAGLMLLVNLCVAFCPAACVGLLLHDAIKSRLFSPGPVIAALILGGVYMMLIDRWRAGGFSSPRFKGDDGGLDVTDLSPPRALVIGLLQIIAMWPGTSRSMMTITGGLLVGLKPRAAAEFSFLLGVPTLLAATGLDLVKNIHGAWGNEKQNLFEELGVGVCILGMGVAAVSAAVAVKWLVAFLNRRGLTPFGWYRIFAGLCLLGLIAGGIVSF